MVNASITPLAMGQPKTWDAPPGVLSLVELTIGAGATTYGEVEETVSRSSCPAFFRSRTWLIDFCPFEHHRRRGLPSGSTPTRIEETSRSMPAFQNPSFQERQQAAAQARSAALAKYKASPPVDESVIAERVARRAAREKAETEKRAAAVRAREEAVRAKEEAAEAKREQARQAIAAAEAAERAKREAEVLARSDAKTRKREERLLWTEDDRKAARDARYAARKARQGRR